MNKYSVTPFLESLSLLYDICPKCDKYCKGQVVCNRSSTDEKIKKGCFIPQIVLKTLIKTTTRTR